MSTARLRPDWKKLSTLLALLALAAAFEILGRALSNDVREAFTAAHSAGDYSPFWHALGSALTSTDLAFLNPRNLTNLMLQVSVNGILAVGMTLVILTGGIDLSVGSVVALTGVVLGLCDVHGSGTAVAVTVAIGAGLVAGGLSGVMISRFPIPPFVITLGMLVIARGLALIVSNSSAIAPLSPGIQFLGGGFLPAGVAGVLLVVGIGFSLLKKRQSGSGRVGAKSSWQPLLILVLLGGAAVLIFALDRGLPMPVLLLAGAAVNGAFLCQKTTFGRALYALGGNETAAVLAGLPTKRVKFLVYTGLGGLAAVCGVVLAGRLNSATPTEGQLLELDAIASAVIGGTSLQGGSGSVGGSVIGAFIIGTLNNGMDLLEVSSNWQMITKGLIIVFAVYSDARLRAGRVKKAA